jgi:hypothetical protein
MVGLSCLLSQWAKLHIGRWKWAVFTRVYIWSRVRDLWRFSRWIRERDSECTSNFVQILGRLLRRPSQWFNKLWGPNLEPCAGVSMACPIKDRPHISWRWRTHRETHKLNNSWNCCTNSRAPPLGSTSDHSRHRWGGGNWLWTCKRVLTIELTENRPGCVSVRDFPLLT